MEPEQVKKNDSELPLSAVLSDLSDSAKDLIRSEVELIKIELKDSMTKISGHLKQVAIFGGLCILSIIPFMAFLIIALGRVLDENYWLSSLIIAVTFAVVGGLLAYRAYQNIKAEDLDMKHSREGWHKEFDTLRENINELKTKVQRRTV
jgi:hypothetical protein